jgi:hypothetical protein
MACIIDSWVPTASITECAEPVGEVLDPGHALVAALAHDVGRPELAGESLSRFVTAHGDDLVCTELLGSEHAEEAHRAVANHGDRLAGTGFGGDRREPARAEHVGGGEEARDQVRRRDVGCRDEGAVGERNSSQLCLHPDSAHDLAVDTGALVAGPADLARVVRGEERADHELTGLDRADGAADLLDDAHILVTYRGRSVHGFDTAVGP